KWKKYPTHTECGELYYSATVPRVTIVSCSYPQDPLTRTSNPFTVNKDIFYGSSRNVTKSKHPNES
ncbi:hypothetical protein Q6264_30100, partial [Klebsiella pneumoniae]|uniref:hypothetical protein n=1 Tax=Klebsiella pneumoniae TaxID=573 RepID=UPI0027322667